MTENGRDTLNSLESADQEDATHPLRHNGPACGAADTAVAGTKDPMGRDDSPSGEDSEHGPTFWPSVPGYEIITQLGCGSMGVVYKARQVGLGRLVALKMISAGVHASQDEMQRFMAEARAVASLQHPNIVQLYEISRQQDCPYFSMELIEGGSLADHLGGLPQPFRHAAQLTMTLAQAIHVAHENGIIHRDLKPANILLASSESRKSHVERLSEELGLSPRGLSPGTPKITDFGLAKQMHADSGQTESGMILGTPSYMAPEQAEGKSRDVGPAADIYALGAILYEMLTGRPPFTAESPLETVLLLFQAEPVAPSRLQPKIPRDLETICLKCLQKEPHRRYASAAELADDLQRFLSGEHIMARPPSLSEKVWKWTRRHPALATLAACAALVVVSFLGLSLWHQADMQARLGQALADEHQARWDQEAANESTRIGQTRDKIKDLLHAGERALAAQDWQDAQLQLTRARDQVADESALDDLQGRIDQLLKQTKRQRLDLERREKFFQRRNDALFQATLFTGDSLASALQETRAAALEALALFNVTPDTTSGPAIDSPYYSKRQKTEIVAACYELLVVLADAVAQPLPKQQGADRCRQAEEALRILERAARLGVTTQAYHRRRARYLAQAGQSEAAEKERGRAGALPASTALDHFLLGQEHYRQDDRKQAIRDFENVLQVQPNHFWASYHLALCWMKTKRPDLAAATLTSCLAQRRDFPWLYLLRAAAWGELGQFARAEADFEAALKMPLPEAVRYGLLVNRGVLRIRQGHIDSARDDLQKAIALRPQQYQGYVNLAQAHLKGQHLNEALEQLDKAVRLEPSFASLYRTRARVHLARRDDAAALADLDQVIRLEGKVPTLALVHDHLERGRLLHRRKEYQRALKDYDDALRLRPHDARGCRLRAETLLELKRWSDALRALDECLKYGPPDAAAFRARAALRTRLGQYAGGQTDYTRALEIAPDPATYAARGWCYLVADAAKLALPDFEEAIRLAPNMGDAYAGRGYTRALSGAYRSAVADAEEAVRRGPPSSRLSYNVARIYAQAKAGLDGEAPYSRRTSDLCADWQRRAVQMLVQALDRQSPADAASFWQNVIQTDKALNSIRGSPGFSQLATRYPLQARPASGRTSSRPTRP